MVSPRLRFWQAPEPVVPVIRLAGVIGGTPSLRGPGLSLDALAGTIERACKVRGAKALALAINSPGGSAAQSALIVERIRTLAADKELPVIAFIEDVGASGGYWLALAGDEIFAHGTSIVGSIGVISAGFGFHEAIERLGIERRLHTAGRYKSLLDPFRQENGEDVSRLRTVMTDLHEAFKDAVRTRRAGRLKATEPELFEGQIWTGRQAQALGLIDGLGTITSVLRERYGPKLRTPRIGGGRPWWQRRLGLGDNAALARDLVDGALDSLNERALWARYGL